MTKQAMKSGLNSELKSAGISIDNPITEVIEVDVNTVIIFKNDVDEATQKWLQDRFTNGVTFRKYDMNQCIINTPNQNNKKKETEEPVKRRSFELKAFYFVITAFNTWGRGLTLKAALEAAKVTRKTDKYVINIGVVKDEATEDQLSNLSKCWNVNDFGGINFYTDGPDLEKDQAMAKDLFVGWITDESFIK